MADSTVLDLPDGVYEDVEGWSGMIRHPDIMSLMSLTAGGYPVKPPSVWFDNPQLSSLTPLTIDDNGRVFGHIAAWHTSHIGMAGGVKPPRSKSNYAYYRTGVVKCDDGKLVDVGQITLTGGHAPLNAGVSRAVAHYDDTASAIMDVAAGEDKHGIWVAGALRPEVSDAQLRSIRASSVSGDWRPINGKLELVAVCAVNAPGFPIPRARVASGAPIAMVAAGTEPLVEIAMNDRIEAHVEEGIKAGLELFRERILRLENVVLADGSPAVEGPPIDADQLRKRVRGGSALAASLRERVRGKHSAEVVDDVQSLAASLRERVKGADAGPKGTAPEALTAARKNWNPLLHPRGADGKFIEVDSWVRWLRPGFGSSRRGKVLDIIPDPENSNRVVARVEFPDRGETTVTHDIQFDELEKVAPPKGYIDADVEEAVEEAVDEAVAETITDSEDGTDGLDAAESEGDVPENRGPWTETSEWAAAVREVRAAYEEWRAKQREQDDTADTSIDAYFDWLEGRGLNAAIVAGLRSKSRIQGANSILGRATEYWTEERRAKAAEQGVALPSGQYPIADVEDLQKAIQAYGRAKNPRTTKLHIIKRANILGSLELLPEGWVSRGFDPAKHLRGPDGRFIVQGSSQPVSANVEVEQLRGRVHRT
jgi:hypothetical protein